MLGPAAAGLAITAAGALPSHATSPGSSEGTLPSQVSSQDASERMKDTRDGYQTNLESASGDIYGLIEWNDYKDSDHSVDIDNFYVRDRDWNGTSIELRVYWKGKTYKDHAYNGETKKIDIGNVPNNAKVKWKACGWNDGSLVSCSSEHYFKE